MTRRRIPIALTCLTAAGIVATACDAGTTTPTLPPGAPPSTAASVSSPAVDLPAASAPTASTGQPLDVDGPIPAGRLTRPPGQLGPRFTTSDDPLPAQTTGALHDAGGQALPVDATLDRFGIYGLPRPTGTNSAVMELDVTATRLAGTDGTSLSAEVLYLVASPTPIDDLLVDAAHTLALDPATAPVTVPDYDGTTGDPRCARLALDAGDHVAASVEGCQYRAEPLTAVRSIGFRRLNLLVTGVPTLPSVFVDVPAELLAAGQIDGYRAMFGRPTGPAGNTVQLRVDVHLDASLTSLGDGWQPDGPGRWWSDNASITVDAGTATWQSSTRAD
jgi:hypothetical protein